ncbi:hypothetical protein [Nocardioides sp.]|uniref:hypothetical protein n=1 Tax=Nocardioides sp. TaxID=35761 RepID=UPI0035625499
MIVAHAEMHDWYVDGDESAVFVGDQVMVISPLATAILQIIGPEGQADISAIAEALVAQFGDPGTPAEELVAQRVGELIEQGILRSVGA